MRKRAATNNQVGIFCCLTLNLWVDFRREVDSITFTAQSSFFSARVLRPETDSSSWFRSRLQVSISLLIRSKVHPPRTVEDSSPLIQYSPAGAWTPLISSVSPFKGFRIVCIAESPLYQSYTGGSAHASSVRGAIATINFNGARSLYVCALIGSNYHHRHWNPGFRHTQTCLWPVFILA